MQKENVVPIPGSSQKRHIRENLAAAEVDLDRADVEAMDAINAEVRTVNPSSALGIIRRRVGDSDDFALLARP